MNRLLRIAAPGMLLCFLVTVRAAETPQPVSTGATFLPGNKGEVPVWMISPPQADSIQDFERTAESFKARADNADSGDGAWRYVNPGANPVPVTPPEISTATAGTVIYAYTYLSLPDNRQITLILNSTHPARLWLGDSPLFQTSTVRDSRVTMESAQGTLRLSAGRHLCRIRFSLGEGPAFFMLFAAQPGKEQDSLTPLYSLRIRLPHGKVPSDKAAPPPSLRLIAEPRFVDDARNLRLTLAANLAGVRVPETGLRVRFTGHSAHPPQADPWFRQEQKVEDLEQALWQGVRYAHTLPDTPPWSTLSLKATLLAGDRPLASTEESVFCERNLLARADRLRSETRIAEDNRPTQSGLALARLGLEQIDLLTRDRQRRTEYYGNRLTIALANIEVGLTANRENRDVFAGRTGLIEGAYISEIDNSVQPYWLYLPSAGNNVQADAAQTPLVILLHGYVPSYNKLSWMSIGPEMQAACDKGGFAMLLPFARSCTDFLTIGEVDVLTVTDIVTPRHNLDRKRTYLCGYSMGGSGAWTLLSHYPDNYAAATIFSGRTDWYYWHARKLELALVNRQTMPLFKRVLIDTDNPYHLADTLKATPLRVVHPTDDQLVKPGHSSRIFSKLKPPHGMMSLNQTSDGLGHWSFNPRLRDPKTYQWMLKHTNAPPETVEHITYTPKYGRKHWLTIREIQNWGTSAHVRGSLDTEAKAVRLETFENISVLQLRSLDAPEPIDFVRDKYTVLGPEGEELFTVPSTLESTYDRRNTSLIVYADKTRYDNPPPRLVKTSNLCGPFKEAFCGPYMLVVGTRGTADAIRQNRANADRFVSDWEAWAHGTPRVKDDTQVTEDDEATYHLICFGSPRTNTVIARHALELPFRFPENGYSIGDKTITGDNLGFCGIYINPGNGTQYLAIIDGLYYGQSLSFNHKWDLVPDYIVFGQETDDYDGTNTARFAGFFDSHWQYQPALAYPQEK